MDLMFVKDEKQLDLGIAGGHSSKGVKMIPVMPQIALKMRERGCDNIKLPVDFLEEATRNDIYYEAMALSKAWQHALIEDIFFHDIDLGECCRLEMIAFFQDIITAQKACQKILDRFPASRAIFFKHPKIASFDQNMYNGEADIFEAVAQWSFKEAGLDVMVTETNVPHNYQSNRKIDLEEMADPARVPYESVPKNTPLIIAMGGDHDLLMMWPYLKIIADKLQLTPFLINKNNNLSKIIIRSAFNFDGKETFVFANDIPIDISLPEVIGRAKNNFFRLINEGHILPPVLQNPLLSFQFEKLFETFFASTVKTIKRAETFFRDHKTSFLMDGFCSGHVNRAWALVARKMGVKTLFVPDGVGANLVEFFDFQSDVALAWGELAQHNIGLGALEKKDRIFVVGNPGMEKLRKKEPSPEKDKSILLITGGVLHQVWTEFSLEKFENVWGRIFLETIKRPHIHFVIKPRPGDRDFGWWFKKSVADMGLTNVEVIDDKKIEDILDNMCLSVLVGKPGTAAYVSLLRSVPVLYLDGVLGRDVIGYRKWKEIFPVYQSVLELFGFIDQLISDNEIFQRFHRENIALADRLSAPFDAEILCQKIIRTGTTFN